MVKNFDVKQVMGRLTTRKDQPVVLLRQIALLENNGRIPNERLNAPPLCYAPEVTLINVNCFFHRW